MNYGSQSKAMHEYLQDEKEADEYLDNFESVEISRPKQETEPPLVYDREEALCRCRERIGRVRRGTKNLCTECFIKQNIYEQEIKRAVKSGESIGYLYLKNGKVIPFIWDPKVNYMKLVERFRKRGVCMKVKGIQEQDKYYPADLIIKVEESEREYEVAYDDD
ncbi:hypothetical protein J2Z48_002937 [Croceifilum oryzae]|uniref:Uncharacterized protein n=1 Tax=Croceifilum oryzae TaxID=1553429 RepID=A0AAJ1WTS8_9BACL|nr:hypothetical protein [Croceifilum oryzae]MDQ0418733.1 hypothetical protein [Croceifilum oryzae]